MQVTDLESSITDFLSLGRQLQTLQPLTGELALKEMIEWYKDTRISNASLDEGGDMLLLQWGASQSSDIVEPTDLRAISDNDLKFSESKYVYLDFTRQVFVEGGDQDVEFDDEAIQMSMTLYYDRSTGDETSSDLWIKNLGEIEQGVAKYRSTLFVSKWLEVPAQKAIITVYYCG